MDMQSENINELASALSKAQSEIRPAIKDSTNPFYNSKYADLSAVWDTCRDPLSKNGLSVIQTVQSDADRQMTLVTTLAHASGQWIRSYVPVYVPKEDAIEIDKQGKPKKPNRLHQIGSALTYLRRYAISSIVGISSDDDDGNSVTENHPRNKKEEESMPKKQEAPISREQGENLAKLLDECDPAYVEKVWAALKDLPKPICGYNEMTRDIYFKFLEGALKNKQLYQSQKREIG